MGRDAAGLVSREPQHRSHSLTNGQRGSDSSLLVADLSKFWQISYRRADVTVRFGRIGTTARLKPKTWLRNCRYFSRRQPHEGETLQGACRCNRQKDRLCLCLAGEATLLRGTREQPGSGGRNQYEKDQRCRSQRVVLA